MDLINERIKEFENILMTLHLSIGTIERLVMQVRLIAEMGVSVGKIELLERSGA